ncbi:MAG: serine/threonine-protein kinase [Nannocystaceae bacterium]
MTVPREPAQAPEADPIAQRGGGADTAEAALGESQLGPAPAVQGSDRMRAALRARLFGEPEPEPEPDADPTEDRDHASRSGVIAAIETEPGVRRTRRPSEEPELAGRVGRFRVLDRLGRGGMGVVFSAYDPELDRKVAIKLLRPDVREGLAQRDAHTRLLREAQAMARLSDPNVIVVHEVGTVGDRVFVAMEYVDGSNLGQWLAADKRGWREVLEVFLKAGSGLSAAHRAGLVHRDFKPDNVLLGHDGRVRVLDFGLARSLSDVQPRTVPVEQAVREQPDLDTLNTPLTRTGAVMGTPAYMSPEQYLGHPADARSDQFSFCVALYEGLYGERPFRGGSLIELADNVVHGHIRETPSEARVPKRLLTAVRRGLSVDPEDRYLSMDELLVELRRDPGRRWRWGGLVLGVGALTSLATFAATSGNEASDACNEVGQQLIGVWDPDARRSVTEAIEGTGTDYAPRVAATTVRLLDDYTEQWVRMAEDACGAALVAQEQDTEHVRRRQCLDQRLAEVGALVDALREPDAGMAEAAVKATSSLTTGLSACTDPRRLAAYDVVDDPEAGQRLAEAHAKLAKAKARGALGDYDRAVELGTEVVEQARAADAGPLEALGLLTRGTYLERTGELERAEADLREAVALADRHGDPGTRAQALITLVYLVALHSTRYDEAIALGEQARGVLEFIDADPLMMANLDSNLGVAEQARGNLEESLALHRSSHERMVELLGRDHPDIGRSLLNIGIALRGSEHNHEAEQYLRQALASLEQTLGPHHPLIGTATTNLGNCLARQGRYEEAMAFQQRSLQIFERALGFDNLSTQRVVYNLAKITQAMGNHAEAAELFSRGLKSRELELPPDDVRLKGWVSHLARSELELQHFERAAVLLDRALALRAREGESPAVQAADRFRLARALAPRDLARARREATSAREALADVVTTEADEVGIGPRILAIDAWLAEHPAGAP